MDHDEDQEVDCDCHDISGNDFLGFDNGCACSHIDNPDQDIEDRIIKTVE